MIEISVKDFGPIVKGAVELKPLTIFVGPSNTGKSYMATLIYAMEKSLGWHGIKPYEGFVDYETLKLMKRAAPPGVLLDLKRDLKVDDRVTRAIGNWAEAAGAGQSRDSPLASLPEEARSLVDREMKRSLQSAGKLLGEELQRCYGPISDIRNRRPGATSLQIGVERDEPLLRVSYGEDEDSLRASPESEWDVSQTLVQTTENMIGGIRAGEVRLSPEDQATIELLIFLSLAVEDAAQTLFADFEDRCYYLPAARSGIVQGHKAIAGMVVRQSSYAATRSPEIPILPGIFTDFIGNMLDIGQIVGWSGWNVRRARRTRTKGVVDFLESEVVRGKVDLDPGGDAAHPAILYAPIAGQPEAGEFPLDRTSSMVSELAPVVLFLKHLVSSGNLVVLEEPESNLHPASQRQMARAIVRLVNAGVKVIITTHSDYFVGQINNLLKLSHASPRKRKEEGYAAEDCLKPDNVSAYHFRMDDDLGGSVVDKLEMDPDFGIDEQEFTRVSEDLYEETVSLQGIRGE